MLRETYCGPIGVEFMHIQDPDQKSWIQRRIEGAPWTHGLRRRREAQILRQLTEAEGFETFCQRRYVTHQAVRPGGRRDHHPRAAHDDRTAAEGGVNEVVIGMPHRGRLNTLVNIVKKPLTAVFSEFGGAASSPTTCRARAT